MEEILPIIQAIREQGGIAFLMNIFVGVMAYEFIRKKDQFSSAVLHLINKWIHFCSDAIALHRSHTVEKLSNRISEIYTILFSLAQMAPIRAMVIRFTHYPRQKFWRMHVIHEADFGIGGIKSKLQGIELDTETLNIMVTDVIREQEKYMANIQNSPAGHLKDLLESFGVRSYMIVFLGSHERRHYSLFVAFNRAKPLTNAQKGAIRLAAQNIKNEIFTTSK